jgi:hypothetical protein
MPEPPRRAAAQDGQTLEATIDHLLALEEAALGRGDTERAAVLRRIVDTYTARLQAEKVAARPAPEQRSAP